MMYAHVIVKEPAVGVTHVECDVWICDDGYYLSDPN